VAGCGRRVGRPVRVVHGHAAEVLEASARALGAAAVVLGGPGAGTVRAAVTGSVSPRLAGHAQCPVVTASEDTRPLGSAPQVMCAVDESNASLRAARFAARLVDGARGRLTLAHVLPGVGRQPAGGAVPLSLDSVLDREIDRRALRAACRRPAGAGRGRPRGAAQGPRRRAAGRARPRLVGRPRRGRLARYGTYARRCLGSVSQGLLSRSPSGGGRPARRSTGGQMSAGAATWRHANGCDAD
jgi:nucleotide-binding universal stress UspA family protein